MYCESYSPCQKCKIVKTYSSLEIDKEKRIYENSEYNYSCIFIPFAVCLIDLLLMWVSPLYFIYLISSTINQLLIKEINGSFLNNFYSFLFSLCGNSLSVFLKSDRTAFYLIPILWFYSLFEHFFLNFLNIFFDGLTWENRKHGSNSE